MKVGAWPKVVHNSVGLAAVPDGHEPGCDCTTCLMADLDAHMVSIGVDPAEHPYWQEVKTPGNAAPRWRIVPWVPAARTRRRKGGRSDSDRRGGWKTPTSGIPAADLPTPAVPVLDRVPVRVEDIGAGAWVRITGWDPTPGDLSTPLTLSGAVVGGPDRVRLRWTVPGDAASPLARPVPGETVVQRIRRERAAREAAADRVVEVDVWAVQIRDYRGNPDRVVHARIDGFAYLVDDPDERDARAAHALDPVFGAGGDRVHLYRRVTKADGVPRQRDGRRSQERDNVSAEQLSLLEQGGAYTQLAAVHHTHRPISQEAQ